MVWQKEEYQVVVQGSFPHQLIFPLLGSLQAGLTAEEQGVWALELCPVSELLPAEPEASSRGLQAVMREYQDWH